MSCAGCTARRTAVVAVARKVAGKAAELPADVRAMAAKLAAVKAAATRRR